MPDCKNVVEKVYAMVKAPAAVGQLKGKGIW